MIKIDDLVIMHDKKSKLNDLLNEEEKKRIELYNMLFKISDTIISYRISKKWTQKQLAEVLDVSQVMVSKLESGEYNPTVEQLWKVSRRINKRLTIDFDDISVNKTISTDDGPKSLVLLKTDGGEPYAADSSGTTSTYTDGSSNDNRYPAVAAS